MKRWWSVHLFGSMRKSGNDLWKIQMGVDLSVGTRRREWRGRRVVETAGTPRRSESVSTERGLKTSRTAPTTVLK